MDILVVTDQEFYSTEPDWLATAHYIIANAGSNLSRGDIIVGLHGIYDATRRNQFHNTITSTEALNLFMDIYPPNVLDSFTSSYPPDIALYLGGYDPDDTAQGMTWGYTNPPDKCRYAWVQMVPDADDIVGGINLGYTGSSKARSVVSTHEIGHMFDAGHETRPPNEPQYARATSFVTIPPVSLNTVTFSYYNEGLSTNEFSSYSSLYCYNPIICHGDPTHDNARRIQETRDTVSMYAHKYKIGVFRPGNQNWYFRYNYTSGPAQKSFHFGITGDIPVTGDFNGDGLTDAGVFRPSNGNWYFDYDLNEVKDKEFHFGITGDIPVVGDFNGNGVSDVAVFRPSNGNWYFDYDLNGVVDTYFHFGTTGDIPVVGNWDGNGVSDIGIFRPSSQNWALDTNKNSAVEYSFHFGTTGDIPVVGDFNGNGVTDVGIFRPSNGYWALDYNLNGVVDTYFFLGSNGDLPVIGDYDGSGWSDPAVFRPSNGDWYIDTFRDGLSVITFHFGTNGDIPNVGIWRRENIL